MTEPASSTKPATSIDRYRPSIDGLRAVAVVSVLVFHLDHRWLPGGFVGVDIFFAISGYLITLILRRSQDGRTFSPGRFYQRRIARLLPAFVACAMTTLGGAYLVYSAQDLASAGASLVAATTYVANLKFLTQGNYFALSSDAQPFLHCWSLSVEEQFYLLFPMAFLLLSRRAHRRRWALLAGLCLLSFAACIAITKFQRSWAFYLLPTRAWEFLAGSLLALFCAEQAESARGWNPPRWLAPVGLSLIAASLLVIREGAAFPGYRAGLPVLGTLGILGARTVTPSIAERLLAWPPLVRLGRVSYSLYLWHWPIFSLVDYGLYRQSALLRLVLKVTLTAIAASLAFVAVESPARIFFNRPERRRATFGFLVATLLIMVPLGLWVRRTNYINVETRDVARGGMTYDDAGKNGALILMGDSHASMYGTLLRRMAETLGVRLNVLSVAAGDPLPGQTPSTTPKLWNDALAVVQRERPDVVLLICNWKQKLETDPERLDRAVSALRHQARHILLLTQPPELPEGASREDIRNGHRPPFWENPAIHRGRLAANTWVRRLGTGDDVTVVDVESHFSGADGSVRLWDDAGRDLYHDRDHLTEWGAALIEDDLRRAIQPLLPGVSRANE